MSNPYDVERSWPDYFLEHRRETVEKQGTYRAGGLPVWTVHCPLGFLGNSIIIEGDDQQIAQTFGRCKQLDVTRVQQVKAAVL